MNATIASSQTPTGAMPQGTDIDVWVVRLDRLGERLEELHGVLSNEERHRAGRRYRRDPRKGRFVARQGALRWVLSDYCGVKPEAVPIERSARGRPRLALRRGKGRRARERSAVEGLEFSVSDSHDLALVAIAGGRPVGADVELVRPGRPVERIARRLLPPTDLRRLSDEPPERRLEAFYRSWTAAEAYAKATGKALPALIAGSDRAGPTADGGDGWSLTRLDPAEGYVGTLVVEGAQPRVRMAEWALPIPVAPAA